MEHIKKYWNFYLAGAIVIIWAVWYFSNKNKTGASVTTTPSNPANAKLANCLKDKGAKFYGASWCPHCNHQRAAFGADAHLLPYVECSNPDGSQAKACIDAGITGYPTWVFPDGTKQPGELSMDQLKQRSGC